MAGERKGIAYETVVYVALEYLISKGKLAGKLFWNEKPDGMSIEPDITIGSSISKPSFVFLITHSSSTKNSDMKFWRNLGELVECKTLVSSIPKVVAISFDSEIKDSLQQIQGVAFDGQVVVSKSTYGQKLIDWVESSAGSLPQNAKEKLKFVQDAFSGKNTSKIPKDAVKDLASELLLNCGRSSPALEGLWNLARKHDPSPPPVARQIFVRRGLTKAALLGQIPRPDGRIAGTPPAWMSSLKLITRSLGGWRVNDSDLTWLARSSLSTMDIPLLLQDHSTEGFRGQLEKVRSFALVEVFVDYLAKNLSTLKSPKGMLSHLRSLRANPSAGISIPNGVSSPTNIWTFDIIGALVKTKTGKSQSFGYSHFSQHSLATSQQIGRMNLGTWCACFMNQYFSRTHSFTCSEAAEELVATVLAEQIADFSRSELESLGTKVLEEYLSKEYEATLLTHRGFDPIGGVLSSFCGVDTSKVRRVRGAFAEAANAKGGAGATSAILINGICMKWQSATDAGKDHKKKELCGRSIALRHEWNSRTKQFQLRQDVSRLVLVLDGTWQQKEIDTLIRVGWDDVVFADEPARIAELLTGSVK